MRLGIGHPGSKERVLGYVLGDFDKDDKAWLIPLLDAVADAAGLLAQGKPADFMTQRRVAHTGISLTWVSTAASSACPTSANRPCSTP